MKRWLWAACWLWTCCSWKRSAPSQIVAPFNSWNASGMLGVFSASHPTFAAFAAFSCSVHSCSTPLPMCRRCKKSARPWFVQQLPPFCSKWISSVLCFWYTKLAVRLSLYLGNWVCCFHFCRTFELKRRHWSVDSRDREEQYPLVLEGDKFHQCFQVKSQKGWTCLDSVGDRCN